MAGFSKITLEYEVRNPEFRVTLGDKSIARFAPSSNITNGKRETVSLTGSTFTALSPPTGAVALLIPFDKAPNTTLVSLTLKGVTGDSTGIAIIPSSNSKNIPLLLPLGSSPSIGILNGGSTANIEIVWL